MNCAACCSIIDCNEEYLRCLIDSCNKTYHLLCTGVKTPTESRNDWICPECRCTAKKGGDNSLTPVGTTKKSQDNNITHRKKLPLPCLSDESFNAQTSELLTDEVKILRQEVQTLKSQISHAVSLIINYDSKMASYVSEVKELNRRLETATNFVSDTAVAQLSPAPIAANGGTGIPTDTQYLAQSQLESINLALAPPTAAEPQLDTSVATLVTQITQSTDQPQPDMAVVTVGAPAKKRRKRTQVRIEGKAFHEKLSPGLESFPSLPQHKQAQTLTEQVARVRVDAPTISSQQSLYTEQWTEVRKGRPASLCGTADPAKTTLKAVEPRKYIHLWNMESNVNEISDYLRQLCPTGTCTVQELSPRGDYKSYKIGVPIGAYDVFFSTDVWPVNARIKAWVSYQRPTGMTIENTRNSTIGNNQLFRGSNKA